MKNLLNIGHGSTVVAERVLAIVTPNSAPMKRLKDEAKKEKRLIDADVYPEKGMRFITEAEHVHSSCERFFDESGGMQLVVHAPLGSRINRAWGLALRKRFCRKFNFELQAAAGEIARNLAADDRIVVPRAFPEWSGRWFRLQLRLGDLPPRPERSFEPPVRIYVDDLDAGDHA